MKAWLGLGSNIGDGASNIRRALELLEEKGAVSVLRQSSLYASEPWGFQDQPDYTNAVAEIEFSMAPEELLGILKGVEKQMGRRETRKWGPRLIDLDLLMVGDLILFRPGLTVPHPRMHCRAFVLVPLAELEPELLIPAKGRVRSCLARLGDQGIRRLQAV